MDPVREYSILSAYILRLECFMIVISFAHNIILICQLNFDTVSTQTQIPSALDKIYRQ